MEEIDFDDFVKDFESKENSNSEELNSKEEVTIENLKGKNYSIEDTLKHRAQKRVPAWMIGKILNCPEFVVAGNSLNRAKPNDFDVYLIGKKLCFSEIHETIERSSRMSNRCHIICESKNSMTVSIDDKIVQFCKYTKPTVEELIKSFDFAHCQVAAVFKCVDVNMDDDSYLEDLRVRVSDVYYTSDWLKSKVLESTFYTGSEYPLSSLIRLIKYKERGMFSGNSYKYELLKIFDDILNRGYENYDDYKDQLDSIDLMLLTEDNIGNAAFHLYETLKRVGLVRKPYPNEYNMSEEEYNSFDLEED